MRLFRLSWATRIFCRESTVTSAFKKLPGVSGFGSIVNLRVSLGRILDALQAGSLHSTGFRDAKSTMLSRGEGSLAEMCCTESLRAERFPKRSFICLLVESSPLCSLW